MSKIKKLVLIGIPAIPAGFGIVYGGFWSHTITDGFWYIPIVSIGLATTLLGGLCLVEAFGENWEAEQLKQVSSSRRGFVPILGFPSHFWNRWQFCSKSRYKGKGR